MYDDKLIAETTTNITKIDIKNKYYPKVQIVHK